MKEQEKSKTPYKSMTSEVIEGKLIIYLESEDIEESIRFAYSLHLSLLPVVHGIYVSRKGYGTAAIFEVNKPNHGK